jgi:hypothetical protein
MDDDRIARLTELARRVWGDSAQVYADRNGHASVTVPEDDDDGRTRVLTVVHPRALDALLPALLVLAHPGKP